MAYITKRGSSYGVRYTYQDEQGKNCNKWESFSTKEEAVNRLHLTRKMRTVQRPCNWRTKRKSHEESYDSSWDFGALEGTRIPGPLIKRIKGASFVKFQKHEETSILSNHRKIHICTHRIICIQCNALQPLSSYSGVQKVCKNVQTGKTKPNGQINHRFYGRV